MSSTPLSTTATVTRWPRVWLHALLKSSACCAHGAAVIREVPRSGGQPGDCPGSEAAAGTGAWTAAMRATPSTAKAIRLIRAASADKSIEAGTHSGYPPSAHYLTGEPTTVG